MESKRDICSFHRTYCCSLPPCKYYCLSSVLYLGVLYTCVTMKIKLAFVSWFLVVICSSLLYYYNYWYYYYYLLCNTQSLCNFNIWCAFLLHFIQSVHAVCIWFILVIISMFDISLFILHVYISITFILLMSLYLLFP